MGFLDILTSQNGGLTSTADGLGLKACTNDGEVLKWDKTTAVWSCSNDIIEIKALLSKLIGDSGSLLTADNKINPKVMQAGWKTSEETGCHTGTTVQTFYLDFPYDFTNIPIVVVNSLDPNPQFISAQAGYGAVTRQGATIRFGSTYSATWCKPFSWVAFDPQYVFN